MRKFSSISNYNVPAEPKIQPKKEENKTDLLKARLINLMNDLLKIQSTGSARTELLNSAITISGKETLADAIVDLLNGEFSSENINLLESMKSEMNDWLYLDRKIDQINSRNIQEKKDKFLNIERRLTAFLELYGDERDFELHTEMLTSRFSKKSEMLERIQVAESMLKSGKLSQKQNSQIKLLIEKIQQRVKKINS